MRVGWKGPLQRQGLPRHGKMVPSVWRMANSHSRIREVGNRLAEILVLRTRRGRSVLLGVVHVGTALEVSYAGCALETQSRIRQVDIFILYKSRRVCWQSIKYCAPPVLKDKIRYCDL
jgi:Cft2 family RNA processing exonuclease